MAELATLGIEVNAKGVDEGIRKLDQLSGAAKRAEAAANGMASSKQLAAGALATARAANAQAAAILATAKASETATQADIKGAQAAKAKASAALAAANADYKREAAAYAAAKAVSNEANAALKAAQADTRLAAANQNIAVVGRTSNAAALNVANLSAQFQDIAVTSAMAMNPLQIALQQGTQISAVLGPMGAAGAVRALGAAFLSVLSPVSLVTIGIVALAAAGLQMVDWSSLAASALTATADVLQSIAPYAAAAAAGLALLYAPAIIGGTVQLIALLGRLSVAALGLAASFAAANPAIAFVAGITAAVAAANIFRDELTQIFGVDIVGAAKTGVNFVIGSFVAAVEDIKFVWNNLPNVVGAAAVGAANAVIRAVNHMINGAKMAINDLISAINLIPGVDIGALDTSGGTIGELDNSFAASLSEGVAARNAAVQAALSHDYLGQIGGAIAAGASAASSKLKELAKDITAVDDKSKKAGGSGKGAGDALDAAAKKAQAAWEKAQQAVESAKLSLGEGFGGILQGLVKKSLSWKDAILQAGQALLKYLDQVAIANGGGGLFGGGLFGGLMKGLLGFSSGGYTGNRAANAVAGVVHGGEYVFSKRATDRIGVGNLEAMHKRAKGYASGGYVAPAPPAAANSNVTIGGSTFVFNGGGTNEQLRQEFARMLDARDKQISRNIGKTIDERTKARETRKVRA